MLKPYTIHNDRHSLTTLIGQSDYNGHKPTEASYSICFQAYPLSMNSILYTAPTSSVKLYDDELPP